MKKRNVLAIIIEMLLVVLVSCAQNEMNNSGATPDLQATIVAGVASTSLARSIEPAVPSFTPTLNQIIQTELVTPAPTQAYPIRSALDHSRLVAHDLDQIAISVNQLFMMFSVTWADEEISDEESQQLLIATRQAIELVLTASKDMQAFQESYGWVVPESANELASMAETLTTITKALQALELRLEQGDKPLIETSGMFENWLYEIPAKAGLLQAQAQSWLVNLENELSLGILAIKSIQPDNVPIDKIAAVQCAFEYVDLVNQTLRSGSIKREDFLVIARFGSNVALGLKSHGGLKLQNLTLSIDQITGLLAQGEFDQAKQALDSFEKGLGKRPRIPTATMEITPGSSIQILPEP